VKEKPSAFFCLWQQNSTKASQSFTPRTA